MNLLSRVMPQPPLLGLRQAWGRSLWRRCPRRRGGHILDRLQVVDDRCHVLRLEHEDRHLGVARDNALGERFGEVLAGYLEESVRKGGASSCGLSPSLPM